MTLYLKYRPQTFEELDSDSVRSKLTSLVLSDSLPHAFLFAGPKGTGKTSAARILAKYLNCENPVSGEPCNKCPHCLAITKGQSMDVIELDAASNRGIDDIRSLRDQVALAPASAKKKIYILDEAHMLTTEAANAFLKTLEEPPSHVVFILATTDPQKLPPTILSRLTTINFSKATLSEISRQLSRVAKGEGLSLDKASVNSIATASDGSFRDAIKILEDLILSGKKITPELIATEFHQVSAVRLDHFIDLLVQKDAEAVLQEISKLIENNSSTKSFADALIQKLRLSLLAKEGIGEAKNNIEALSKPQTLKLLKSLVKARPLYSQSPIESLPLELLVIKWCDGGEALKKKGPKIDLSIKEKPIVEKASAQKVIGDKIDEIAWSKIMSEVRTKNASVEAFLRAAHPLGCDGRRLMVGVHYRFHKERLEVGENKLILEEAAGQILGNKIKVVYTLTDQKTPSSIEKKELPADEVGLTDSADGDIISAAKEIFGA